MDDTVIYVRNVEKFLTILDRILSQMATFNVRLKPSKWFLEWRQLNSWDISSISVKGIQELLEPTYVKGV